MQWASELLLLGTMTSLDGVAPPPDEVEIQASELRYISASWEEVVVRGRPWVPFKRLATVERGTRFIVRGEVPSRDDAGCKGEPWYAVWPFGFVCSLHVREAESGPELKGVDAVDPKRRVPFNYAFVREDGAVMYENYGALEDGVPSRPLTKGMSLAVERSVEFNGELMVKTTHGEYVPKSAVRWGGQGSSWSGVVIEGRHQGPSFAWAAKDKVVVRDAPTSAGKRIGRLKRRQRVPLLRSQGTGKHRWLEIAAGRWVAADDLNEVHISSPPRGVLDRDRVAKTGNDQWIDVDLGEQVLVAYRGEQPVFATLISSGRSHGTPMGNYPVWAKVASMDMANQPYEDRPYLVQGVPWVLLFQGHNALHGAYWHDGFGRKKSHGCVNLAPLDARWIFEWAGPQMHEGWSGWLPSTLEYSVMVHVRDSSRPKGQQWTQQRRIGPPDREKEAALAAAAEERRAEELAAAEAAANFLPPTEGVGIPGSPPRLEAGPPPSFGSPPAEYGRIPEGLGRTPPSG